MVLLRLLIKISNLRVVSDMVSDESSLKFINRSAILELDMVTKSLPSFASLIQF